MLGQKLRRALTASANVFAGRAFGGWCPLCRHSTWFIPVGSWYREDLKCLRCRSSARQRALAHFIDNHAEVESESRILEPGPARNVAQQFRKRFPRYEETHFFPEASPGETINGYRNENLECLTYADESLDLVVTQDVFEHIARPGNAFRELARVLRVGGMHVFTIPWFPGSETRSRAREEGGCVQHLMAPEYHGNPIDANGSLVFTEFGKDLPDVILDASGMRTQVLSEQRSEYGMMGESLEVFCSCKG